MSIGLELLAEKLSEAIGVTVEITIRSEEKFTFSTDEICHDLEARCVEFFAPHLVIECKTDHDEECGSFVYMAIAQ
ncbi:hypothetical protein HUU40_00220 [candidate division KSB1 bacterium]|nr:hypothetical protein [candidate division KSB1 bacterium]